VGDPTAAEPGHALASPWFDDPHLPGHHDALATDGPKASAAMAFVSS
jgi:hypothetical protein